MICIQVAKTVGKCVRPSHNNNSKGLATNNVSRETIKKNVSRETIIVFPMPKNTLFCIDNKEDIT